MWFPDLGQETMIDGGTHIRAIGWLAKGKGYQQGIVTKKHIVRMRGFAKRWYESTEALGCGIFMGLHTCEFCRNCRRGGNFGVPAGELLYVAPDMLPHYVEEHSYRLPDEFLDALMACPLPRMPEYTEAAKPFAALHQEYQQRQLQLQTEAAAQWAKEQGGSEAAVCEAVSSFFCRDDDAMLARIREALGRLQ